MTDESVTTISCLQIDANSSRTAPSAAKYRSGFFSFVSGKERDKTSHLSDFDKKKRQ